MIKSSSTKETDEAVKQLVSSKLVRHTVQFYNKSDDGKLKPFASGVLLKTHNAHFILTASHVANYFEKEENDLYIQVDHKSYINVLGDIKYTDIDRSKGIDMAYIKIDPQMVEPLSKPYIFLTIDQVRNHNKRLDAMNYCIVGFPENNVKRDSGKMETGADFYLTSATNEKPYEYYKFNPKDFYLVEMKGKELILIQVKRPGLIPTFMVLVVAGFFKSLAKLQALGLNTNTSCQIVSFSTHFLVSPSST